MGRAALRRRRDDAVVPGLTGVALPEDGGAWSVFSSAWSRIEGDREVHGVCEIVDGEVLSLAEWVIPTVGMPPQLSEFRQVQGHRRPACDALSCCFPAAAVVDGVGGPVTSAGALPGDRDADVDAEHAGEQRCGELGGELGGELEQRGGVDECPPTRRSVSNAAYCIRCMFLFASLLGS